MSISFRPCGVYSTILVRSLTSPLSFINLAELHGIPVHAFILLLKSIHRIVITPKVKKAPCEMQRGIWGFILSLSKASLVNVARSSSLNIYERAVEKLQGIYRACIFKISQCRMYWTGMTPFPCMHRILCWTWLSLILAPFWLENWPSLQFLFKS